MAGLEHRSIIMLKFETNAMVFFQALVLTSTIENVRRLQVVEEVFAMHRLIVSLFGCLYVICLNMSFLCAIPGQSV